MRYIFAILDPETRFDVLRLAHKAGIVGNANYGWLFEGGINDLSFDAEIEQDLIQAFNGVGFVQIDVERNQRFYLAMDEMRTNSDLQEEYISVQVSLG